MKKLVLFLFLFNILTVGAYAQKSAVDTAKKKIADTVKKDILTAPDTVKKLHSNPLSLVPPSAMIAYGALSFAVHPIRRIDYYIQGQIRRSDSTFSTKAESYFQFTPILIVYGLNLAGVPGKNRFIDRTALLGLSGFFVFASEGITKKLTHRLRPNKGDYLSFPSGHTGLAFMGAEFMAQEYDAKSPLYGVAAYLIGTTTGVFRLYNRDHWFSDVVAGAGFGILSTKLAYLVYPSIRNWITHGQEKAEEKGSSKKRMFHNTQLTPTFQDGGMGFAFSTNF